jgi:hypothetical protein
MKLFKDASSHEKKAVADGMSFRKDGRKHGRNYICAFCGKDYRLKGACQNHVYSEHYGAIKVDAERIKRKWDEKVEEMTKENALKYGRRYFEHLESSVKSLLQEVERHHRDFDAAIKEKPYAGSGEKRKQKQAVDEIGYCMHHVGQNFQGHESEGVNAVKSLVSAFKFEF